MGSLTRKNVMGIVSAFSYDGTGFLNTLTTPYGTTTFAADGDNYHQGIQATNPLGQTERAEIRYNSVGTIADTDIVPNATGLLAAASGLSGNNAYYWTRRQYSSPLDYTKATVTHWMNSPRGLTNIVDSQKKPLEDRVWYNYAGQTAADYLDDTASASPTITARLLDPNPPGALSAGLYQATYASYNSTGLVTQSIDPLGRTTNYLYDTNNIDLLTVKQVDGTGQDLLGTMTYNSQHEPLTVTDAAGQVATLTYNAAGQVLTRTVTVNSANQTTTLAYNSSGYLSSVTGPVSGATTSYTYDSYGRVQTVTDSEGYVVTTAYDNFDRPTTVTYPGTPTGADSKTDQTVYKNLDVVKTIDRQGRVTTNQYVLFSKLRS